MNFKKKLAVSMGVIAGSFIFFGLILGWLRNDVRDKADQIYADKIFVSKQSESIGLLAALKHTAPVVDGYQKKIDGLMPTKDELINFPKWIESAARARGISATVSFQGVASPPEGGTAGFVSFALDVKGEYGLIAKFFKEIESESSKFILAIDNFDINLADTGYRVSSNGKVFYR